jgi:two-component system OmpR family sensor kinase
MTPSESIISVRLRADQRWVRLDVSDNGPPIPESELPHVFDPFRLSASARGAGLGLAIAKALVEEMGGILDVGSLPSGGAMFSVRLVAAS